MPPTPTPGTNTYHRVWAGDPRYVTPSDGAAAQRALNTGSSSASGAYVSTTGLTLPAVSANYASVPDSAALSVTTSVTLVAYCTATDWTPAAVQAVVSKYGGGGSRSYSLRIDTNGTLRFTSSADGTNSVNSNSTAATGFTDGTGHWIMSVFDDTANTANYYTSDDGPGTAVASVSWTLLGTANVAHVSAGLFDSAADVTIGGEVNGTANLFAGSVQRAVIGTGSTSLLDVDFRRGITNEFTAATGQTVTVRSTYNPNNATGTAQPLWRASSINGRPAWDFVSSDSWTAVASLSQPFTTVLVLNLDTAASQFILGTVAASATAGIATTAGPAWSHNYGTAATGGTPAAATPVIVVSVGNGASSKLIVNGTTLSTATANTTAINTLTFGRNADSTVFLDGQIGFADVISGDATAAAGWVAYHTWLARHYRIAVA